MTYWIMACVELHAEILPDPDDKEDDDPPIAGYFRNFGVTAGDTGRRRPSAARRQGRSEAACLPDG